VPFTLQANSLEKNLEASLQIHADLEERLAKSSACQAFLEVVQKTDISGLQGVQKPQKPELR